MPNGPHRITGLPFEEELYKSEHSVEDKEIQVTWTPFYGLDTEPEPES